MTKNMAIINLEGFNEKSIFLVSEEIYEWIVSDVPSFGDQSYIEEILPDIVVEYLTIYSDPGHIEELRGDNENITISLSRGSYTNDRAMLLDAYGENHFNTMKQLINYVNDNGINITNEFDGRIY